MGQDDVAIASGSLSRKRRWILPQDEEDKINHDHSVEHLARSSPTSSPGNACSDEPVSPPRSVYGSATTNEVAIVYQGPPTTSAVDLSDTSASKKPKSDDMEFPIIDLDDIYADPNPGSSSSKTPTDSHDSLPHQWGRHFLADLYSDPTPGCSKDEEDYLADSMEWDSSATDRVNQDHWLLLDQLTMIFPQLSRPRLEEFARHNHRLNETELAVKMEELFQEQEELERIELLRKQREKEHKPLGKYTYFPSRNFNPTDPKEMRARTAEGVFLRMLSSSPTLGTAVALRDIKRFIHSIVVIENERLEEVFDLKKKHLANAGISSEELLLFHGTDVTNVDAIIQNNFDLSLSKRQLHGSGIYFSEHPSISLGYGNGLILCRVLPGLIQNGGPDTKFDPSKYDSYCVNQTSNIKHFDDGSSEIHVIKDPCQILPYCIIHLNRHMAGMTTSLATSANARSAFRVFNNQKPNFIAQSMSNPTYVANVNIPQLKMAKDIGALMRQYNVLPPPSAPNIGMANTASTAGVSKVTAPMPSASSVMTVKLMNQPSAKSISVDIGKSKLIIMRPPVKVNVSNAQSQFS